MKKIKYIIYDGIFIAAGTFFLALSVNVFLAPNKVSSGGITSIGTVLLYLFGIKMSVTNIFFNAVLFVAGYKQLGRYAVVKTVSGIIFLSLFLEITDSFPVYNGDILICSASGGILMGLGVGLAVRVGASTGGSDFAALILKRFFKHISVAKIILAIDTVVIVIAGLVFRSYEVMFYSIIALCISSKVTDVAMSFGNAAKAVRIFSAENEQIAQAVMKRFSRGVSGLYCRGMYSEATGLMLFCVVNAKEIPSLIKLVRDIDRTSFIVINDVREVLGEGFEEE